MGALRFLSEGGGGPNTELLWLLFILIGFLAVVVAIGWRAGSSNQGQAGAGQDAESHEAGPAEKEVKMNKPKRGQASVRRKK
jgi:hypothetical protein